MPRKIVLIGLLLIGLLPTIVGADYDCDPDTNNADTTTVTNGMGQAIDLKCRPLPGPDDQQSSSRGYPYCELVFNYDSQSDIYSTSPVAPCKVDWWESLDLVDLAKEYGASSVTKNGPQVWTMDKVSVMVSEQEYPMRATNGTTALMVFGAVLPPATTETAPYEVFCPAKTQYLSWKANKPTYKLVDPDGYVYILQGAKQDFDTVQEELDLPAGWSFDPLPEDHEVEMNLTPDQPIPSVTDNLNQIYIGFPPLTTECN